MSVDMVDGTPVLDVKPYIPYDIVPHDKDKLIEMAAVDECTGRPLQLSSLSVPAWIYEADVPLRLVEFSECAQLTLSLMQDSQKYHHCTGKEDAMRLIKEVLRQDIRSTHQGRGRDCDVAQEGVIYECKLDAFMVKFRTLQEYISVEEISF
jgi:hypothetical protein